MYIFNIVIVVGDVDMWVKVLLGTTLPHIYGFPEGCAENAGARRSQVVHRQPGYKSRIRIGLSGTFFHRTNILNKCVNDSKITPHI